MYMKERIQTILIMTVTLAACAVFASTLVHASLFYQPEEEVSPTTAGITTSSTVTARDREAPAQLIIPAIDVEARVQDVGLGKSGNMAVPSNFTDVGWYRYGPAPGQTGSAVIDGHVDNGFGISAVFNRINELKPGDDIFIETKDDSRMHFIVADVATYDARDVPADMLFNKADTSRLNLITCAGAWNPESKSYDRRVVIYAVLANS